jgi:hypothetical protein
VKKETGGSPYQRVALDDLVPDSMNARKGNVAVIVDSLREFGQHRPIVVQKETGRIIAGNHTFFAAQTLGWEEIDVIYVDDDDVTATRRAIADNATGDHARWDERILKDLLESVGEDVPGVDQALLDRLAKLDEVPVEETPIYPIVPKPGEGYSYVVIIADTVVDVAWLETAFDLQKEQSYKSTLVGKSKVLTVERFRSLLGEMAEFAKVADE